MMLLEHSEEYRDDLIHRPWRDGVRIIPRCVVYGLTTRNWICSLSFSCSPQYFSWHCMFHWRWMYDPFHKIRCEPYITGDLWSGYTNKVFCYHSNSCFFGDLLEFVHWWGNWCLQPFQYQQASTTLDSPLFRWNPKRFCVEFCWWKNFWSERLENLEFPCKNFLEVSNR